jgi:hypothetical protein
MGGAKATPAENVTVTNCGDGVGSDVGVRLAATGVRRGRCRRREPILTRSVRARFQSKAEAARGVVAEGAG